MIDAVIDGVGVILEVTDGVGEFEGVCVGVAEGQTPQVSHIFGVTVSIWVVAGRSTTKSPITQH